MDGHHQNTAHIFKGVFCTLNHVYMVIIAVHLRDLFYCFLTYRPSVPRCQRIFK
jgi:hypothetical protein